MGVAVGGHVLLEEGDSHCLGGAGLQQAGFGVLHQVDGCLFDAVVHIKLGIGSAVIDLDHILARHAAGVGDLDLQDDFVSAVPESGDLLLEGCVTQPVSEGVDHAIVPIVVGVALPGGQVVRSEVAQLRRRLIPAVAQVDALLVLPEGSLEVRPALKSGQPDIPGILRVLIDRVAGAVIEIHIGGSFGVIGHEGVHRVAGGVHRAVEDLAQGFEAHAAGGAHLDDGVDAAVVL